MEIRAIHITDGVCSTQISFVVAEGKVSSIRFEGGCQGNLEAISRLAEGMDVEDAISKLEGIRCADRSTSCPDQLALALKRTVHGRD